MERQDLDQANADAQADTDHEFRVLSTGEPADVQEVFAPVDQPFEAPAKTIEVGPYYKAIEEIMPELAMETAAEDAAGAMSALTSSSKLSVDRRDFMRLFSASAIAASTACVRRPVEKAIPYLTQPADLTPGVATHFASTCGECSAACGVVIKTREGRPVKVEGNDSHPISQGGTCALGQASLQGLYHPDRARKPVVMRGDRSDQADWEEVYEILGKRLAGKRNIGILTAGATGNRHKFFRRFLRQLGAAENNLYTYESNSLLSATAAAHKLAFGLETLPRTDLRQARTIVGIGSDFLEIGISPVFNAKTFAESQGFVNGAMGKFIQFEAAMTQTGARAHFRHVIPPASELVTTLLLIRALYDNPKSRGSAGERREVAKALAQHKAMLDGAYERLGIASEVFAGVAEDLLSDKAVIMCGGSQSFDENATQLQLAAIMANVLIGAYGSTLFIDKGWMTPPVVAGDMRRFLADANKLDILFIVDTNPAFTMPASWDFGGAVKNIPLIISIQPMPNETDRLAHFVLPGHHYAEAWGDEQPVAGFWSLRQPAVRPVTDSRQAEDIMLFVLAAMGKPLPYREYYEYIRDQWKPVHSVMAANQNVNFDTFFKAVQRRGFVGKLGSRSVPGLTDLSRVFKVHGDLAPGLRLLAPLDVRLRDGRGADKPVLQEVGDSMTTIAWDTWIALNPNTAKNLGFKRNDVLLVEGPAGSFKAALYPLPGLHPDAVVVPRGNGRHVGISRVTDGIGVDPLVAISKAEDSLTGDCVTSAQTVKLSRTGAVFALAAMQKHNDIANRTDIVKKISLKNATANMGKVKDLDNVPDIFPKMKQGEFRWGMSVDLTSCTGCSACMVACSVENNIPQVGRELVQMGRAMHWIRLDRYFYGDVDKPEVTYQPVMCQHCMHAPCEAVCPVYATTHDPNGMNVQTYNRCVGTRYCANACPYKVRRFNWFTYKWNVIGENPRDRNPRALNPDVTVRTRGVMEKCTFCVQRIKEVQHTAKVQGVPINDGEVRTACQQACPSNAITFGNLLNGRTRAAQLRRDNRAYLSLGGDPEHGHYGIKTLPNVSYLAKVTHQEQVDPHAGGHGDDHHDEAEAGEGHHD